MRCFVDDGSLPPSVRTSPLTAHRMENIAAVEIAAGIAAALRLADEGIAQLREAIARWRTVTAGCLVPYFLALLADAYATTGQTEEALTALAEALAVTERTPEGSVRAGPYPLKAELQLDPARAEPC